MRRLALLCAMVAALAAAIVVPTVQARPVVPIGMGDQNVSTFTDAPFRALHLRYARFIVPWNGIRTESAYVDSWVRAARAAHERILVAFNPARGSHCPKRPCRVPRVRSYVRAFKAWRKKYPFVREFNFWNETNSKTQPTGVHPKAAAKLYNAARKVCRRRCTLTGPDILDQNIGKKNARKRRRAQAVLTRWVRTFLRYAHGYPKIWGFHNYGDTNYRTMRGTAFFLRLVRGKVWVTETGGIVYFKTSTTNQVIFRYSERRAKRATGYAYRIAKRYRRRIRRLYYYQWRKNNPGDRFDAGIERINGTLRPSYRVLRGIVR